MSLGDVRSESDLHPRKHDLITLVEAQRRGLHELKLVTATIAKNASLSDLLNFSFDSENSPPLDANDATWLDENGLAGGHYFDDSSLPFPPLSLDASSIYPSKPNSASPQLAENVSTSSPAGQPFKHISTAPTPTVVGPETGASARRLQTDTPTDSADTAVIPRTPVSLDNVPSAGLARIAPPTAEEAVNLTSADLELVNREVGQRPAKTVHLPSQEEQEEQMRQRRQEKAQARLARAQASNDESRNEKETGQPRRVLDPEMPENTQGRLSRVQAFSEAFDKAKQSEKRNGHLQVQTEQASSPSSTVGALSAATPVPPQESPDTSPNSETEKEVVPPKDLRPSPEEKRAQEEHDRLLEAQKEIAHQQALGDITTPTEEVQWEVRAATAAARNAEERNKDDAETVDGDLMDVTEVERAVEEADQARPQHTTTPTPTEEEKPIEVKPEQVMAEEQDTIKVTHRSSDASGHADPATGRPRVSSTILGETQPLTTPRNLSPLATRHPADQPKTSRFLRSLPTRTTQTSVPVNELASLKGAAQDPDRDYLEPLFRIQAPDSPNARTKPLPNLVKDANKCLSTDDHYTTAHERLDYRILRRIYQLQNANKWSLRQMEKPQEPDPPMTHHDHMMAEMKWMRKDFRAERRMKKSVCAWLAKRCSEWVAASVDDRKMMQVRVREPERQQGEPQEEELPELEPSGDSAPEDGAPATPTADIQMQATLVIAPELSDMVTELHEEGKLSKILQKLPVDGLPHPGVKKSKTAMVAVSKFVESKVFPSSLGPGRKRSRYNYEDEAETLDQEPSSKRMREERTVGPEDQEVALFHPDNKHIRDRLHANNAFRPPSEFVMPSTSFYEFRNGSQWIWEDDQKLRKLAKEYSFNWSLIADEMTLPSRYKSSAERRTPWECFERWVELESLPAEMKKTVYFKTWDSRLAQSQKAADRRYELQVRAIQEAANNAGAPVPIRRKTTPSRVEKRKNTRYLWLVDAMRKMARKRENNAYKTAEAQRAAAQRKAQTDNTQQQRGPMLTPLEFSKRRYESDVRLAEAQRLHRQKMLEAQQRQIAMARAAQQGQVPGVQGQQRPGTGNPQQQSQAIGQIQANGQQVAGMNGQAPQQQIRSGVPVPGRNGHIAVPQVNGQPMQPGPMRPAMQQHPGLAPANGQGAQQQQQQQQQQQYQAQQANMANVNRGMSQTQQLVQKNEAILAQMQSMKGAQGQMLPSNHQMSASPSMPPPPAPHGSGPQQLSSGHVPALLAIKNQIRAKNPHATEEAITQAATYQLKSQSAQTSTQARQNAMNAIMNADGTQAHYGHNQAAFQSNGQMSNGQAAAYMGDPNAGQQAMVNANHSPQTQAAYAAQMRQRQMQMMRMQQSPNGSHASLHSSPGMAHASPNLQPASPSMGYANMAQGQGNNTNNNNNTLGSSQQQQQQRPPSRSNTPQMQRVGSSGSVPSSMGNGMQSPGPMQQQSPRNMQASMAR